MKDLISFLAIWFKNLKEFTWKVTVSGADNKRELDNLSRQLTLLSRNLTGVDGAMKGVVGAVEKLEKKEENQEVRKLLENISKAVSKKIDFPKIDIPKEIVVSNFPEQTKFPKSIEVSNFPKIPETKEISFPKLQEVKGRVQVENQLSLEEVIKGLQTVVDVINELRVEMPKSLSGGGVATAQSAAKNIEYKTNNVDTTSVADTVYVGKESKVGDWIVSKIDTSAISMIYATPLNNKGIVGYSEAWTARLSLTYNTFSTAK